MRRLLAYLFVVLGFGFILSGNAEAKKYKVTVYAKSSNYIIFKFRRPLNKWNTVKSNNSWSYMWQKSSAHCRSFGKKSYILRDYRDVDSDERPITHIKYRFMCAKDPGSALADWTRNIKKFKSSLGTIIEYSDSKGSVKDIKKQLAKKSKKNSRDKLICTVGNEIYWYEKGKCSSQLAQIIKPDHSMYDYFYDRAIYFPGTTQTTEIVKKEETDTQNVASAYYGDPLCVNLDNVNFLVNDSTNCRGGLKEILRKNHSMYDYYFSKIDKTQIVKSESNQTQKVPKNIKFCVKKLSEYVTSVTGSKYKIRRFDNPYHTCKSNFIIDHKYKDELFYAYLVDTIGIVEEKNFRTLEPLGYWKPKVLKKQTQIAKAESNQTQNVASAYYGDPLCVNLDNVNFLVNDSTNCRGGLKEILRKNHSMYDYYFSKIDKTQIVKKDEVNQKGELAFCLSKIKETNAFVVKKLGIDPCEGENIIIAQNDIENLNLFNSLKERFEITDGALIVTNEQIEIFSNNKNTKLVLKQKQDEFKPENKDVDKDAPIIEIAQNITVDSQTYKLKGRVKDKSRFFLTIDDRPIKVAKNGQFEFEGFAIDPKEQLKIVAIDRWKNKSEKIINVEVKIKQVAELRSYEKPNPSRIKVKKDNNKIGIIIGIEKYQNLNNIDAPYANRDAKAFKAYANIALGIPNNNLKVLIDEDATRGELLKSLKIWLPQITRGKGKDIYIFFAGHGLASDNGEDLHILPHNGDPILLEDTALSRVEMFDLINKVNPKSVTMFFDTCYSGQTRSEQMLIAGLRPVRIVADEQDTPNNFTIFTASNYDQTSGSINEAEHGIFSYYLMKGLEGKADKNSDKKITNGELISYLKNNVTQEAFSQNRSQEPMLSGDPDKVLISYR